MKRLSRLFESAICKPNGFCLLKPGFLKHETELDNVLMDNGWTVIAKKKYRFTPDAAAALYVTHKDQPWYNDLCNYMCSGDCLCYNCHKDCGDPCGELKTIKHDFRDKYGINDMKNCMHSSDNPEAVSADTAVVTEQCKLCESIASTYNTYKIDIYDSKVPIVDILNVALAEEFLAHYAYMITKYFIYGNERTTIETKFAEFGQEELVDHAESILKRLNELGECPRSMFHPSNLIDIAYHKYIYPERLDVKSALNANILAEKGAIETYTILEARSRDEDVLTNELAKHLLADETKHLTELADLLKDIYSSEPCAEEAGCSNSCKCDSTFEC